MIFELLFWRKHGLLDMPCFFNTQWMLQEIGGLLEQLNDLIHRQVFIAGTDLGEGLGRAESAALAAANVVGRKQGPLSSWAGLEDLGHGHVSP